MTFFGEPEWGTARQRPANENRLGGRTFLMGEYSDYSTGRSVAGTRTDNEITPAIPEEKKSPGPMKV